jgi:hypothetical protein
MNTTQVVAIRRQIGWRTASSAVSFAMEVNCLMCRFIAKKYVVTAMIAG